MSQGPAVPTYILRGHKAALHALKFLDNNRYLVSGDSEGWLVVWSLASKRSVGVWRAHSETINAVGTWGSQRLLTHGRDHKLRVWKLDLSQDGVLQTTLPVDNPPEDHPKPWLLHSLDVSALNFCNFAVCEGSGERDEEARGDGLFIACANALDSGGVDIFHLPSERRVSQLLSEKSRDTGMVMALALFSKPGSGSYSLASGYEDGQIMIHRHQGALGSNGHWQRLWTTQAHSQVILSIGLSPSLEFLISSSADARLVKVTMGTGEPSCKTVETKHAGQQGLHIRSDSKICATAGWDSRIRVYSAKTLKELAVLKWHKDGCYATAFAEITSEADEDALTRSSENLVQILALEKIKQARTEKAQQTHWLAAGAKDGKISLWDIY